MFLRFRVRGIWVMRCDRPFYLHVRVEAILIRDRRSNSHRNECSSKDDRIEAHTPRPSSRRSFLHGGSTSWRFCICGFRLHLSRFTDAVLTCSLEHSTTALQVASRFSNSKAPLFSIFWLYRIDGWQLQISQSIEESQIHCLADQRLSNDDERSASRDDAYLCL